MLNSGKKIRALRDKKNKYSKSRVVRKKKSEPPKLEYFFQQHWESEYFFRKKP
jgi:hypothetical protein